jgi:hypothetical protein
MSVHDGFHQSLHMVVSPRATRAPCGQRTNLSAEGTVPGAQSRELIGNAFSVRALAHWRHSVSEPTLSRIRVGGDHRSVKGGIG